VECDAAPVATLGSSVSQLSASCGSLSCGVPKDSTLQPQCRGQHFLGVSQPGG